jgi:O-antigen chain-terminating methyltransferase
MSTDRLHISSSDLDVERLMHEIRQNVTRQSPPQEAVAPRPTEPIGSLTLQPPFQPSRDNRYHINDLLRFHGEDFVRNSYRALLLREPDEAGMAYHLQSLASGRFNKIDVLASLHYSHEGRQSGVTVDGLSTPATIRRLGRIPVLGYLLRMIIAVLRLPASLQYQNQFEQYSLSLQQRIVDHQNQHQKDLKSALAQLAREMLETVQTVTKQQQALELSLRQHDELAAGHNELVKTLDLRFDEARRYVDDLATQTQAQQLAISQRQDADKQELLAQQQQLRSELVDQITKQQQLRSEIDEQLQQLILRQQRAHDELAAQEGRLRILLEEVSRNGEASPNFVQVAAEESDHLLDGLYASFEDQFRGERDEVRRRLQVYVPILKEAQITGDVLDIGVGRGEWLQLLESEGIKVQGVDRNRVFVDECRRAGLTVIQADALTHLRTLPPESLNAITSFHLVEHLPFEMLINLLDEMARTLRRGGLLILETPNPENLLVGGCNFYADPTHRHPIPSQTLQFLLEARGFHDIKILKLRPWDEARIEGDSEIIKRFNDMFYSAPDYGIIATRT